MNVKEYAERLGLAVERNNPGDGKSRYQFFTKDKNGNYKRELFKSTGRKQALELLNAFEEGCRYGEEFANSQRDKILVNGLSS